MYRKKPIEELSLIHFKSEIASYSYSKLQKDLFSGLSIACISIPQALGYALIATLSPIAGIISICIGTFIGALLTSSSHLVIGPNNASALLLQATLILYMRDLQALTEHPLSFLEVTAILTLLVSAVQLVFAFCHLGKLIQFVSHSVTTGYILGTALALAIGQIFPLLGIPCPNYLNTVYEKATYLCTHLYSYHPYTAFIGLLCASFIVLFHRLNLKIPPSLIVLITITPLCYCSSLTNSPQYSIETILGVSQNASPLFSFSLSLPSLDWGLINTLLPTAFAMALIGMLEANSIARSMATKTGEWINPNQEIFSLGFANFILSFFSGMPCSGSTSRSSLNVQCGGKTSLSTLFSALIVILLVIVLFPYIQYIPKACLAAILCTAALRLFDRPQIFLCLKATRSDALVFIATLLSCVFLTLSLAFYVGIVLSIMLYLRKASTPSLEELVYHEESEIFFPEKEGTIPRHPQIRIVNVEGELFFGATDLFQGTLRAIADDDTKPSVIIVRLKHVHDVDATTAVALKQLKSYLLQKQRHLIICSVPKQILHLLEKTDLVDHLGLDNIIPLDEHHPKTSFRLAWKRALSLVSTPPQGDSLDNPELAVCMAPE